MEILNIGPVELIIFLVIAFLLLGPRDMVLTAYKIGETIRKFVRSPIWREIYRSAQDIRELPKRMMDETGLQQELDAIKKDTKMAADEVNASIKEAVKAAEVPEAQHLRIDGRATDSTVPAAVPTSVSPSQTTPPPATPPAASKPAMPAVFDGPPIPGLAKIPVAQEEPPMTDTPAEVVEATAQEEEPVLTEVPVEQEPAVLEEAPLPEAGVVEVVDTPSAEGQPMDSAEPEPAPKPARKRAVRKTTTAAVETLSEEQALTESPETVAETPKPARKRTTRKKAESVVDMPAELVEAAPNGGQPAVLSTTVTEPAIPTELLVPPQSTVNAAVPVSVEEPASSPSAITPEETPKPARKRTKKAVEPAETPVEVSLETAASTQSTWNPAWEPTSQPPANMAEPEEPPAPKTRTRRARVTKPKANGTEEGDNPAATAEE